MTVSLEQDKYRIEQIISKNRGNSRDKPSSQRYSGQDPEAFNIPKFADISSKIKCMYTNELCKQLKENKSLTAERVRELQTKWELDVNNSLFINRRTSKIPFHYVN